MRVIHPRMLASAAILACCQLSFQAAPAEADGPYPITSSTECFMMADPGGGISTQLPDKGTISPSGGPPSEDIHVRVTCRNVLGAALPGATVTATAVGMGGASFVWDSGQLPSGDAVETPQSGLSDGAGRVELIFDEGGVHLSSTPVLPDLDFDVWIDEPGPTPPPYALNACNPKLSVLSYDLNGDGRVNLTDFATFAQDFGAGNQRSDFNWSGSVNLTDFAAFASSLGASLDAQ